MNVKKSTSEKDRVKRGVRTRFRSLSKDACPKIPAKVYLARRFEGEDPYARDQRTDDMGSSNISGRGKDVVRANYLFGVSRRAAKGDSMAVEHLVSLGCHIIKQLQELCNKPSGFEMVRSVARLQGAFPVLLSQRRRSGNYAEKWVKSLEVGAFTGLASHSRAKWHSGDVTNHWALGLRNILMAIVSDGSLFERVDGVPLWMRQLISKHSSRRLPPLAKDTASDWWPYAKKLFFELTNDRPDEIEKLRLKVMSKKSRKGYKPGELRSKIAEKVKRAFVTVCR